LQLIKQKTATTNVRRIRRTVCIADVKRLFISIISIKLLAKGSIFVINRLLVWVL